MDEGFPLFGDGIPSDVKTGVSRCGPERRPEKCWNPWHGCRKYSEGCRHCYVYRIDGRHGKDASAVGKNKDFTLPVRKNRRGDYKIPTGCMLYTCFSSDFFLDEADGWRPEAWKMMRLRSDVNFFLTTKRIVRAARCLPADWGKGYPNVTIACTVENQRAADERTGAYLAIPQAYRMIICEPLLGRIKFSSLDGIGKVTAGGESGPEARVCDYAWILDIRGQCAEAGVSFSFKQTGANFRKDGRLYRIPRPKQHSQAVKAGVDLDFRP